MSPLSEMFPKGSLSGERGKIDSCHLGLRCPLKVVQVGKEGK